jgi:hypothetical protein
MTQKSKTLGFGIASRKGAKTPSSEEIDKTSYEYFSSQFSDLCKLSAFAEDIPSFACAAAAPGPLR